MIYEFESDEVPESRDKLSSWAISHGVKILELVRKANELEIAKLTVGIDAFERGADDEIPKSVMEFLQSKEKECSQDLPKFEYLK